MDVPYNYTGENQKLLQAVFDDIILKCWKTNPDERPTFKSLHELLTDDGIIYADNQLSQYR